MIKIKNIIINGSKATVEQEEMIKTELIKCLDNMKEINRLKIKVE